MMSALILIGIDVGTSGVRGVAVDPRGTVVAEASRPLSGVRGFADGVHEQNPHDWWKAVCEVGWELTGGLRHASGSVVGVSVTSTSGTLVVTDKDGVPLRPAVMYDDARASIEADSLNARLGSDGEQWNHSHSLTKALWVRNAEPDTWERTRWLLHPADWLTGMLCGTFGLSDPSNALKLGYQPEHRNWSPAVELSGIPQELLPKVQKWGASVGELSSGAAEATGLPQGVSVLVGATDGIAALVASGAKRRGDANTTLGTTIVWKVLSLEKPARTRGTYCHQHPSGLWAPGAASNSGPGALRMQTVNCEPVEMDRSAAKSLPASVLCYPLNGTGERFPFLNRSASTFVEGQPDTELDWWAAQLQAIGFLERWGYEVLAECGAKAGNQIYSAGGAAQSATLSQLRADILQREIFRCRHPTAAFGAAVFAASGLVYGGDCAVAIREMARVIASYEPQQGRAREYDELYQLFRAACDRRGYR